MLSFYEMLNLLESRKLVKEALDKSTLDDMARQMAELKARRAAKMGPTEPVKIDPVTPPAEPAAQKPFSLSPEMQAIIANAQKAAQDAPATTGTGSKTPAAPTNKGLHDINDPDNKTYAIRSSGGVKGNTVNAGGLAANVGAAKGTGNISRQMDSTSTSDKEAAFKAKLTDKMTELNQMLRFWPTMRLYVNYALAEFGKGPLAKYGKKAPEAFAKDATRTPDSDKAVHSPFQLVLSKGSSEKDNKFGDLGHQSVEGLPEVVIEDPRMMAKVIMASNKMGQMDPKWAQYNRKENPKAGLKPTVGDNNPAMPGFGENTQNAWMDISHLLCAGTECPV